MFWAINSPIFRTLDCVYSLRYNESAMLPAGDKDEVELVNQITTSSMSPASSIAGALYHNL